MFAYKERRFQEKGMEIMKGRNKLKDTDKHGSGNNVEGVEL